MKLESVATCRPYSLAPLEGFHSSLGVKVGTVERVAGDLNVGAAGGASGGGSVVAEASLE